jgi:hypothetical protein
LFPVHESVAVAVISYSPGGPLSATLFVLVQSTNVSDAGDAVTPEPAGATTVTVRGVPSEALHPF